MKSSYKILVLVYFLIALISFSFSSQAKDLPPLSNTTDNTQVNIPNNISPIPFTNPEKVSESGDPLYDNCLNNCDNAYNSCTNHYYNRQGECRVPISQCEQNAYDFYFDCINNSTHPLAPGQTVNSRADQCRAEREEQQVACVNYHPEVGICLANVDSGLSTCDRGKSFCYSACIRHPNDTKSNPVRDFGS